MLISFQTSFQRVLNPKRTEATELNILLFGLAGATKSSFVNSIFTMLSKDDRIQSIAAAGGSIKHVTGQLGRYRLGDKHEGLKLNLWDTWGLTPDTFQEGELEAIIKGELPPGWDKDVSIVEGKELLEKFADSRGKRAIHAVIFFVPQSVFDDPTLVKFKRAIQFYFEKLSTQFRKTQEPKR
jgi:septin family protein